MLKSIVRDWQDDDRDALLRFANNRRVWRNLKDRFPHPYGEAQADAWLGEPYWGRGIMTETVRAVSGHALTRLGFAREGVMGKSVFKDGPLIDYMLYARVAG